MAQEIVNRAQKKLNQEKKGKLYIGDDYREFLNDLASKRCSSCKKELEVLRVKTDKQDEIELVTYEFVCGHKHSEINFVEKVKIWDQAKGKIREGDKKPRYKFLVRTEPGKNPKTVDGAEVLWVADRKNNKWKHVIKDIKTGKILHNENILLDKKN